MAERADRSLPRAAGPHLALVACAVLAVALTAVAYARTFGTLGRMWSHNDNYSHGFLIPPVSILLVWLMRRRLAAEPRAASWGAAPSDHGRTSARRRSPG